MRDHLIDYPPDLPTPNLGMQESIDRGLCVFCNQKRDHDAPRFSCNACQEFLREGFCADVALSWLNEKYFRMGALLCARQMGFRGKYVRVIARDVENQRKELWETHWKPATGEETLRWPVPPSPYDWKQIEDSLKEFTTQKEEGVTDNAL